jgi:hypothetical protein
VGSGVHHPQHPQAVWSQSMSETTPSPRPTSACRLALLLIASSNSLTAARSTRFRPISRTRS